ncbi:ABC transporter permease [Qipengyuania psychrotolerans]|uniref:ABC transporter permease n=1 Tax=Qipengyuania psychrotolerans TaxID=2867238 RepID=A0ABX8ZDA0_9SPHN|nr:ABC transporter permease [Qipengyuania psychrotolerans]QZD86948.1 ABC transporter permease [Qipengyuania psychrotolerans]
MDNASRLPLWRAALVIARRDFTAILFSKAFLFFLLGPIFFGAISIGAGALGAKAADSADPPRLAVALSEVESAAFADAHSRLDDAVRLPAIAIITADEPREPDVLLADTSRNFGAVLSGSLAQPKLSGTQERLESWQGEVALLASQAAGGDVSDLPEISLQPTATSVATTRSVQTATATGAITLLFLLTMLLAGMVLSNLVEEKANKIIEILAAAIPMEAVFYGKLFAMLGVSFVGIAVWGGIAGIILSLGSAAMGPIPVPAVGWPLFVALFVTYFAMAYLLIGAVFLTIGSMAPTVRDVQTLSMPATILQLAVFFLATYALSDPGSGVELFAVLFPVSSPYAMVARAAQSPVLWTHAAAIAWQLLWVAIFVRIGSSMFRKLVMKSGAGGRAIKGRVGNSKSAKA